ncbi:MULTISPECIES: response regulator [Spirosoma]|jgi:two-component system chemotaxis response regulator CheY|uniref:Response regulator n=2 Tax=Spirosoma TaxID=107 RepID=A0A6G9ATN9_9BACT|nr:MULTISPECIES: response regulator [Spirosoma]QHV99111.1 response regulator [Spirosoma endbachense]QIP15645.1 response regulator [Spirosoma aureum]
MKILVVDDETDIQPLFEQRFRREIRSGTMTFTFANSGESALAYLAQKGTEAVLILSDINMPGMSGLELLRRIRKSPVVPSPIVMMITAYGDQQNHDQAIRDGADDFLTKPIDFAELKNKLSQLNPL